MIGVRIGTHACPVCGQTVRGAHGCHMSEDRFAREFFIPFVRWATCTREGRFVRYYAERERARGG